MAGYKVLYGEVREWNRDHKEALHNPDLETVGEFDTHSDAFMFIIYEVERSLEKLGYNLSGCFDFIGDIWWIDEDGHHKVVATTDEDEASIVDTDEWWVIVED